MANTEQAAIIDEVDAAYKASCREVNNYIRQLRKDDPNLDVDATTTRIHSLLSARRRGALLACTMAVVMGRVLLIPGDHPGELRIPATNAQADETTVEASMRALHQSTGARFSGGWSVGMLPTEQRAFAMVADSVIAPDLRNDVALIDIAEIPRLTSIGRIRDPITIATYRIARWHKAWQFTDLRSVEETQQKSQQ